MKTKFIIMSIASLLMLAMNSFSQTTHNIDINASSFSDADIIINVGDKVIWTNNSGMTHTVTEGTSCTNNGFDSGNIAGNGGTFERTFSTAGTVNYFCTPHCSGGMVGKITVVNTTEVIINSKLISQIKTFPNPFVSTSEIQIQLAHAGKVTVEIYDMYGHRLMELPEAERTDGLHKFAISGESLRDGIFICKVYVNGKPAASEYLVKKSKSE